MAASELITEPVTVNVKAGVKLSLTNEEADALAAVLARIGGPFGQSRRGLTSGIADALREAGYDYPPQATDVRGEISFVPTVVECDDCGEEDFE